MITTKRSIKKNTERVIEEMIIITMISQEEVILEEEEVEEEVTITLTIRRRSMESLRRTRMRDYRRK